MGGIYELANDSDWAQVVDGAQGKVLVEFFAHWCGFCQREEPILEEAVPQIEGSGTRVVQADIEKFEMKAQEFGVTGTPTFVLFENGMEINKNVGFMDADKLLAFVS